MKKNQIAFFRQRRLKKNPRNKRLNVRLTQEEYDVIATKSKELNIKPGEYAYCLLTQKDVMTREASKIMTLVSNFANNMNQLATIANSRHGLDPTVEEGMNTIIRKICSEFDKRKSVDEELFKTKHK